MRIKATVGKPNLGKVGSPRSARLSMSQDDALYLIALAQESIERSIADRRARNDALGLAIQQNEYSHLGTIYQQIAEVR